MVTCTTTETTAKKGLPVSMAALASGGDLLVRERERPVVSTGFGPLDALLPAGGVRPGSLVEWLAEGDTVATGGGAATLAFAVACRLAAADAGNAMEGPQGRRRTIVVVDRTGWFHPPAVMPWLADERRLVVARPARDEDEVWAIDQALRCTGVAAVLAWPRARSGGGGRPVSRGSRQGITSQQWSTVMRRWQLAAASSGAVGLFVRPRTALGEPSWAEARIAVSPHCSGARRADGLSQSGGVLTERLLRLTLAGGNWAAITADGHRAAEITLDVARGCAGVSRRTLASEQAAAAS
ncbi:MAG: ImuA family protein, partial [Planctomycetaceae bacterium]